ncbi:MAG: zinc ribbon domain-containing protein [Acidobacteriota bacterium]|nr:zinc ribbon domain-containing protein [Acidobacteriota bacterium]
MFIFIGGIQPKTVNIDKQARNCPACSHFNLHLKRIDQYLSLFFIPLFPVKKGMPFLICENCNSVFSEDGARMDVSHSGGQSLCPKCKIPVNPDFSFCPYCGHSLRK